EEIVITGVRYMAPGLPPNQRSFSDPTDFRELLPRHSRRLADRPHLSRRHNTVITTHGLVPGGFSLLIRHLKSTRRASEHFHVRTQFHDGAVIVVFEGLWPLSTAKFPTTAFEADVNHD